MFSMNVMYTHFEINVHIRNETSLKYEYSVMFINLFFFFFFFLKKKKKKKKTTKKKQLYNQH